MDRRLAWRVGALLLSALTLTGCGNGGWFGDSAPPPLPGKRITVLREGPALKVDANAPPVAIPPPAPNSAWPQAGGLTNHAMQHMEIPKVLHMAWSTNVGAGSTDRVKLLAQPVVADGRVFTVDSRNLVTALDAGTGRRIWQVDLTPADISEGSGGGLAYWHGRLYVATGFAQLVAMDVKTGKIVWRRTLSGPMRGAPTVRAGRVFVITVDDQTHCLAAKTGQELWTHQGISEQASLLAGTSPAVDGNVVVVPYSSGELFALRSENGAVLWQDQLSSISRTAGLETLTDITALPIIDRGRVYAIGHADMMVAIDLRTGRRIWEHQVGGTATPWIAGNYLFVITNNNYVLAVDDQTGAIVWKIRLPVWSDPEDKSGRIVWTGPVLASNRLLVAGSNGQIMSLSPYSGKVMGKMVMSDGVSIPPVVANGTLYIYTNDADVIAYR
jgi:outer membrane protein assembly factor BamB